jgi:uncharacterized membrane protein
MRISPKAEKWAAHRDGWRPRDLMRSGPANLRQNGPSTNTLRGFIVVAALLRHGEDMTDLGRHVYGLAAILLGLVGLWWGDFASPWQSVSTDLPGHMALAYVAALLFVASGVALQFRRTAPIGSIVLVGLYAIFALLRAGRAVGSPQIFALWLGTAEELALVVGGIVSFAIARDSPRTAQIVRTGRLVFGLCLLIFGVAHLVYVPETAAMVPAWLPPSTRFWAIITGVAHLAGGLALLSNILAWLAARLVTAMFIGFGAFVWLPQLISTPTDHMVWGGNGVNLALVGAIWIIADAIAPREAGQRRRSSKLSEPSREVFNQP